MPQYRITNAARADIVDILRFYRTQFGDQAQALILSTLQSIAGTPYRTGCHDRDELVPDLRSYHHVYSRQQAKHPHGMVKSPRHIVFYRVANDDVIEVVKLLHDAMEVSSHLPTE
ncbi:type II toxin-antitoxin system RelE/ParE family toxin [Pseudomonas frederiksbergensis]|uniref:type II toxin-antitoxin system RelE/ParE family toxin n=1 Tax=Pseudomonas frederiksbergensis TaxID=104087 RepID=UPI000F4AD59A|nr:type II toxin-antitoxin system RelE/ParE family toxin [Pseudomonas frederiksbergensis]RON45166.1 plasmid stabilization protein ParE [Pseudomonas frederiksbergensis]